MVTEIMITNYHHNNIMYYFCNDCSKKVIGEIKKYHGDKK